MRVEIGFNDGSRSWYLMLIEGNVFVFLWWKSTHGTEWMHTMAIGNGFMAVVGLGRFFVGVRQGIDQNLLCVFFQKDQRIISVARLEVTSDMNRRQVLIILNGRFEVSVFFSVRQCVGNSGSWWLSLHWCFVFENKDADDGDVWRCHCGRFWWSSLILLLRRNRWMFLLNHMVGNVCCWWTNWNKWID